MKILSVSLTYFGRLFLLILLSLFVGAINYNNSLAYLLVFVFFSLYALTFYQGWKNIKDLKIFCYPLNSHFMGEPTGIKTQFSSIRKKQNNQFNFLSCEYQLVNIITQEKMKHVAPFLRLVIAQKTTQEFEFKPISRGCFQLAEFVCSSQYPLALFKWTQRVSNEKKTFYIYPAPIDHHVSDQSHRQSVPNKTGAEQFKELSRYQEGDPLSKICWKTYARTERLMTKIFEDEQENKQIVYKYDDLGLLKKEQKLSQLCYWIKQAHQKGFYYGLNIPGHTIKANYGTEHYHQCLIALAQS